MLKFLRFSLIYLLLSFWGCLNSPDSSNLKIYSSGNSKPIQTETASLSIESTENRHKYNGSNLKFGEQIVLVINYKMFINEVLSDEGKSTYTLNCSNSQLISMKNNVDGEYEEFDDFAPDFKLFIRSFCSGSCENSIVVSCGSGCAMVYEVVEQKVEVYYEVDIQTILSMDNSSIGDKVTYKVITNENVVIGIYKKGSSQNLNNDIDASLKEYLVNFVSAP